MTLLCHVPFYHLSSPDSTKLNLNCRHERRAVQFSKFLPCRFPLVFARTFKTFSRSIRGPATFSIIQTNTRSFATVCNIIVIRWYDASRHGCLPFRFPLFFLFSLPRLFPPFLNRRARGIVTKLNPSSLKIGIRSCTAFHDRTPFNYSKIS